jgi:hypothetical protein
MFAFDKTQAQAVVMDHDGDMIRPALPLPPVIAR